MLIQVVFGLGIMVAVAAVSLDVYATRSPSVKALGAMAPLMLDVQRYVGSMTDCSPQTLHPEELVLDGVMDRDYAAGLFTWRVEVPTQGRPSLVLNGQRSMLTAIAASYSHSWEHEHLSLPIPATTLSTVPDLLISVSNELGSHRVGCL